MDEKLTIKSFARLSNQVAMPRIGLGSAALVPWTENQVKVYRAAIECGYRLLDVASIYFTETACGKGIQESGIPREEFFISSKLWFNNMRRGRVAMIQEFEESLRRLRTDYLDLYLFHWPTQGSFMDAWEFMENLYYAGRVRAIGISNCTRQHIMEIIYRGDIVPHVHQNEFHPYNIDDYNMIFCERFGIHFEGFFPFGRGKSFLNEPVIKRIGEKYGKNVFQTILRWNLQHGVTVIPGSVNPAHMKSNTEIYDFELTPEEMAEIDSLNSGKRWCMKMEYFT
jgi:methylglyoxal/glyoxal reductase